MKVIFYLHEILSKRNVVLQGPFVRTNVRWRREVTEMRHDEVASFHGERHVDRLHLSPARHEQDDMNSTNINTDKLQFTDECWMDFEW